MVKRVIVTGAAGFVGANLARRLLKDGHQVHLLLRRNYNPWRIAAIQSDVRLREVDFADKRRLSQIVHEIRPDWVFHVAAHGAYPTQVDLQQMIQTNLIATINLVEACLKEGFDTFVNTGSSSEYGFKSSAPNEREWLEPNSYYAWTKAAGTLFCRYVSQHCGAQITTLRLYSVYGPYEEPTRLIPSLVTQGLSGRFPPLADPDVARDYVHVEDVNDAYLLAAKCSPKELGAVYNVGTGCQTPLRQVVEVARQVMNISAEPQWGTMPNRAWDTHTWVSDSRKIDEALGWRSKYTFEQGFRGLVDWFREDRSRLAFYLSYNKTNRQSTQ